MPKQEQSEDGAHQGFFGLPGTPNGNGGVFITADQLQMAGNNPEDLKQCFGEKWVAILQKITSIYLYSPAASATSSTIHSSSSQQRQFTPKCSCLAGAAR